MPNHVTNIVSCKIDISKYLTSAVNNKGDLIEIFDFNLLIPMPKDLGIVESNFPIPGLISMPYEKIQKMDDYIYKNFLKGIDNIRKYGYPSWYPWSVDKWGTKWNSYDVIKIDNNNIVFNTAWNTPEPIFKELSKQNDNSKIIVITMDEGKDELIESVYIGDKVFKSIVGTFKEVYKDTEEFTGYSLKLLNEDDVGFETKEELCKHLLALQPTS
jgi:hypothetical protein